MATRKKTKSKRGVKKRTTKRTAKRVPKKAAKRKVAKKKVTRKKTAKRTEKKGLLSLFRSKKVLRKVYLTFPRQKTKEAIICDMYDRYQVRFNIRSASVDDQMGLIALEMESNDLDQMNKAFRYFEKRGVKVEPIEISVIEP